MASLSGVVDDLESVAVVSISIDTSKPQGF